ncbi:PREDICTED: uncharacterized protein LOC105462045 [Wasmannia auropunctata]|uniref:uncharacterized protein LOC105462045 n=1 Tax=Wasmannia auropunctata TaxID=64793 RepID=UPI0005F09A22|nr:PREDICTED: uncharacterized protein LOC105462045 [Wasmannia auropunctata]
MRTKIKDHISNCLNCIAFSPSTGKSEGFLHPIPKDQRGPNIDGIKEYLEEKDAPSERDLESIREEASTNIIKSQEYNQYYFDQRRKKPHQYKKGDYVGICNFDSTPGAPKKLNSGFKGPYDIALKNDRYIVKDVENSQTLQRPYKGT